MRKPCLIALLAMLGLFGALIAQTPKANTNLENIDIYSFDPLSGHSADPTENLKNANAAYQAADYEQAARNYLAYLQMKPSDSGAWYNLSCCYGLLGKPELAAKYLQRAYKNGFRDLEHIVNDRDFEKVRSSEAFSASMDSLKTWNAKRERYSGKLEYYPLKQFQPYRLLLPDGFNKEKTYNLIIGLHGFGDKATGFAPLWRHMEKAEVIFVVPEAPYAFPESEVPQFSWDPFLPRDSEISKLSYEYTAQYIVGLTNHLKKEYKIGQTWLLGFSQGAYLSYIIGLKNPRTFDGFLACGGGLVKEMMREKDYKSAKNLKILISHGSQDKIVDYQESADAAKLLSEKGLSVQLHTFEGGHSISKDAFPLLFDLMKTKQPNK